MSHEFQNDLDAIARISAVPSILDVVCKVTGMGFAAVARVTEDRWIVCQVLDRISFGLEPGGELEVRTTICDEIRCSGKAVIIDNVLEDAAFRDHHTPAQYGFQSYISVPIVLSDGRFFGTLCAIDPQPARLNNPETIKMFGLFSELIAFHLDANDQLDRAAQEIIEKQRQAERRDQYIAVLGHDLLNPIASIEAGARMLMKAPLDDRSSKVVKMMRLSVNRMAGIIDNVLDLARARIGNGVKLNLTEEPIEPLLSHLIDEISTLYPERVIERSLGSSMSLIPFDKIRMGQLFSNLLVNAIVHGDPEQPVRVGLNYSEDSFLLWVSNGGPEIPDAIKTKLFTPFFRGDASDGREGLGLGLYIASEIAKAHGGQLELQSDPHETRLTLTLPLHPQTGPVSR